MLKMRLRGYVTPEDFVGTDTQKIQQIQPCAEKDHRAAEPGELREAETPPCHGQSTAEQ